MTTKRKRQEQQKPSAPSIISFADGFQRATSNEQLEAIGSDITSCLYPFPNFFSPIPQPLHEDDWLAQYPTRGQTLQMWLNDKDTRLPDETRVVYLRPLHSQQDDPDIELDKLVEFVSLFYPGVEVQKMKPLETFIEKNKHFVKGISGSIPLEWRKGHKWSKTKTPNGQFCVFPILDALKEELPKDAFCVVAVTSQDLYEGPDDEFVIGMAGCGGQTGAFSFARYNPAFPNISTSKEEQRLLLARSCKVLVHEIGHLFNLDHCPYFACCMNGSGHLQEDFRQPLHFCPICLAKLQHITQCDLVKRYEGLLRFYEENAFTEEAVWVTNILIKIQEGTQTNNNASQ